MRAWRGIVFVVVLLALGRGANANADEWLDKCNAGDARACGVATNQLLMVEQWDQAEALVLQSCARFGTCSAYGLVDALRSGGQTERALKLATRACDEGDLAMCAQLGSWAKLGYLVPRDPARAVVLLDRVCNSGQVDPAVGAGACGTLAARLRYDEGMPRD